MADLIVMKINICDGTMRMESRLPRMHTVGLCF